MPNPNKPRAGTPTGTNLYVLDREFATTTEITSFPSTSRAHMRRLMDAGLVAASNGGKSMVLTARGAWVLKAMRANGAAHPHGHKHLTAEQTATLSDEIAERVDMLLVR